MNWRDALTPDQVEHLKALEAKLRAVKDDGLEAERIDIIKQAQHRANTHRREEC